MVPALVVIVAAAALFGGDGGKTRMVRAGGDPARGLLVNRTWGTHPFDPPDPGRATVVFVHGFNPAPRLVHFTMDERLGQSVARRGGPAINVLGWDWNAATFDNLNPRVNSHNAVNQGFLLAGALRRSGIDPSTTYLIGHSAGGMVATAAAWDFVTNDGRQVARLTLLDPATIYHEVIFERLKAGSLAPRVENYWSPGPSAYGREVALPGVWDYRVEGTSRYSGVLLPLRSDHLSIVNWYLGSVENPRLPWGFNTSPIGFGR